MRATWHFAAVSGLVMLMGCGGGGAPSQPAATSEPTMVAAPPPPPPAPVVPPKMVQEKAQVGVGEKGRGYKKDIIATPIASYFAVRERLVYDIQIPEAMKLFHASEDRYPKTHEEFMERIVKENHIHLPQLPEGHRYVYNPKEAQLMVEHPE